MRVKTLHDNLVVSFTLRIFRSFIRDLFMDQNKLSTALSAKLVSSLGSVKSLVNTAEQTPDLLISRKKVLTALSSSVRDVDGFSEFCRRTKETRHVRQQMKHLHNSLVSLSHAVEADDIDADDLIDTIKDEVGTRLMALEALSQLDPSLASLEDDELDLIAESSREVELSDLKNAMQDDNGRIGSEVDIDALKHTVRKLNVYDKFRSRLSKTLASHGSIVPIEVPVVIKFHSPALKNHKNISMAFPGQVDLIGVQGKNSADVGVVLTNQTVIQFSKEGALSFVEENLESDDTVTRLKNARVVVNNLKKRQRLLQKELEQLKADEKEAKRRKVFNDITGKRISKRTAEINSLLESLETKIQLNGERVREAASVKRAKVKVNMRPEAAYFQRVNYFLEELSKRGHHYTLLSNAFVVSPANPDILLAWAVPREKFQILSRLSSGNTKVLSWGLPWSKQASDTAGGLGKRTIDLKNIPESMKLSTRIPRMP